MVELFKKEYWSKSQAFLLPLTGLSKTQTYKVESYLFWENYSIEDYFLIVKFTYDKYDEFLEYCKRKIFPDFKSGYVIETYDFDNQTVMILDISEWAFDIDLFLRGRYSKMSREAKDIISEYHIYYDKGNRISLDIKGTLEPNEQQDILGKLTPIEYASQEYGFSLQELKKVGEIGGIYNKEKETLTDLNKENDYYLRKEGSTLG